MSEDEWRRLETLVGVAQAKVRTTIAVAAVSLMIVMTLLALTLRTR